MRNLYLMSFTKAGEETALRIAESLSRDPDWTVCARRIGSLSDSVAPVFKSGNVLVFVGAAGIAVRAVAPLLKSKQTDPAVLVVDETGRFVIPLLSGHIGGANRIAARIAAVVGAVPVITTATDLRGVFAVDTFASENGYAILDPETVKTVSARLLDDKPVGLAGEFEISGPIPKNFRLQNREEVGIYIGLGIHTKPFEKTLRLVPKCFHVGIGTRRGVAFDDLNDFFVDTIDSLGIPVESIADISSIDLKRDEQAIVDLAKLRAVPFRTYSVGELREFEAEFASSNFVRLQTGVGNVCEIAAWLSSKKGDVVLKKTVRSGMTLAVARKHWVIRFGLKESGKEGAAG